MLWYLEVEGMDSHEVAPLMGLTAHGVAALAMIAVIGGGVTLGVITPGSPLAGAVSTTVVASNGRWAIDIVGLPQAMTGPFSLDFASEQPQNPSLRPTAPNLIQTPP